MYPQIYTSPTCMKVIDKTHSKCDIRNSRNKTTSKDCSLNRIFMYLDISWFGVADVFCWLAYPWEVRQGTQHGTLNTYFPYLSSYEHMKVHMNHLPAWSGLLDWRLWTWFILLCSNFQVTDSNAITREGVYVTLIPAVDMMYHGHESILAVSGDICGPVCSFMTRVCLGYCKPV